MNIQTMNDLEAKLLVDEVFSKLEILDPKISPKNQINKIFLDADDLIKFAPNTSRFPRLSFELTLDDINYLTKNNLINSDNCIQINDNHLPTPLEKLLFSILWKQGDLGKEKHIIDGILNNPMSTNGIVFYYFGKHLNSKFNNPIIDQHVIRAFRLKLLNASEEQLVKEIRLKDLSLSKKDHLIKCNLIENYLIWHKKIREQFNSDSQEELSYYIDLLLFALGKKIKINK
jgi:hypothetical protein